MRNPIPKGLCLSAQGCEERATLGHRSQIFPTLKRFAACGSRFDATPVGVDESFDSYSQGSSFLATLGWKTQPRWGSRVRGPQPQRRSTPPELAAGDVRAPVAKFTVTTRSQRNRGGFPSETNCWSKPGERLPSRTSCDGLRRHEAAPNFLPPT